MCEAYSTRISFEESMKTEVEKEREKQIQLKQYTILLNKLENSRTAITSSAESLRPGQQCSLDLPASAQTILDDERVFGALNIHFPLTFDDGVKWLIRVRQAHNGIPPMAVLDHTAKSEVVTLRSLKSFDIPVPQAWMPSDSAVERGENGTSQDNSLCYFFCEFLPGKSLFMRHIRYNDFQLVEEKDRQLIEEYARYQIQLSNHPISAKSIGSLVPSTSGDAPYEVGPLLSLWGLNHLEPPYFPGPFKNNQERLEECDELRKLPEEVNIRHADDKGDIFMGDAEGNLAALIDWEWACVTTKKEAFSAPTFAFEATSIYLGSGRFDQTCYQRSLDKTFAATKPRGLNAPFDFDREWSVYFADRYKDNPVVRKLMEGVGWDQEKIREEYMVDKQVTKEKYSKLTAERRQREAERAETKKNTVARPKAPEVL
ncbi:hypothetical protein I302_102435 [Kwoniella bestiolae CBS 10118]|uniref:Aminoglycoside phosphotransferase domain-containing protein n=1 Tax=Kwoniella bestiolae CBS 10118 TaxID=1296100 RepID=A0AAJ8M5I4_9TREE